MPAVVPGWPRYSFGPFELNTLEESLARNGACVKVQELPYRLLVMVVERPVESSAALRDMEADDRALTALPGGRLGHLHRPDRGGAHIHRGTKVSVDLIGFGGPEPVSLRFIDHVIDAPSRVVAFILQSIRQHERGHTESCASPDLLNLFVTLDNAAIDGHAIHGTHFTVAEFHHVKVKDFLERFALHFDRYDIAQSAQVRVPLSGELVGLDVVAVFAARVVAKVFSVPKPGDVSRLTFGKFFVVFCLGGIVQHLGDFLSGAQRRQPKSTTISAVPANDPDVVG